jgi:cyanate lyase
MNAVDILKNIFQERINKNPKYSLRAFARDIGLSPSLLSMVMSGQRQLTAKQAAKISLKLKLSDELVSLTQK